jgi:hypothetical protein
MKLDWAILANHAEVQNGLVYLLGGGVDAVNSPTAPASFIGALVIRFDLHQTEVGGSHNVDIRVANEDGKSIAQIRGVLQIGPATTIIPVGWPYHPLMVFNFQGLLLPTFGQYSIEILADGTHLKSLPFMVKKIG